MASPFVFAFRNLATPEIRTRKLCCQLRRGRLPLSDPPKHMKKLKLGSSNLQITLVCLGTMAFGEKAREAVAHDILDPLAERGVNFLYTAEMHSVPARAATFGATETIIGNWSAKNPAPEASWFLQPRSPVRHGDCKVSTTNMACRVSAKSFEPCKPEMANRHSGHLVGGISPFGMRKQMSVFMEATILELPRIAINGGSRGCLIAIDPQVGVRLLGAKSVQCALVDAPQPGGPEAADKNGD